MTTQTKTPAARRRTWILAGALAALLAAAGLGWALLRGDAGHAEHDHHDHDGHEASAAPLPGGLAAYDLDGDGLVYQCGMHPQIVQDEPGRCPICGMDLTPVPVTATEEGLVEIDPVTVQNMGVRTAEVEVRALERSVRAAGTFEANERARVAVSLRVGGWVERLHVSAEGDRVRAGQPLLELYSPELVATQEEFLLALRSRALLGEAEGGRLLEAARRRLLLFGIRPEQVERLEAEGEVQRTLTLHAPASGTVLEKQVVEGQQVMPGQTLMQIVDLSQLWLQVAVPEQDLGWMEAGVRATVEVESRPGEPLSGRVEHVYDTLDPATRTGTARVVVPNPGRRLKPGMFATATLFGAPSEARPVVPAEAVIHTGEEAVVIVALGEGRFRPQPVVPGAEAGGLVQILEGLAPGERVVTSAQFLIDSEARLASALAAMAGHAH